MGRLIDADKLKAHYAWWECPGEINEEKRLFDEIIDQQPTADAVPVTRCKECRYYGNRYHRCGIMNTDKNPDGFCDEAVGR